MNALDAIILGIVEGLTEFLPVSSTGHLLLASRLLDLPTTEFQKTFDIAIQVGAIAAVLVLHWREFLRLEVLKRVAAAFVPTAVIGLLLYKVAKQYLLGSDMVVLAALFVGGIVLIGFEWWYARRVQPRGASPATDAVGDDIASMTYAQAATIGVAQTLAIVPGVSRSAASIVGGLALGLRRETVVRFSFLLAVPTIGAAAGLDLLTSAGEFGPHEFLMLAIGAAVSFVVALAAIRFFLQYVRTRTFVPFGVYRIVAAVAFFLWLR